MSVDVEKYKRLFGIECDLLEFCPDELKRRWRVLCQKYHPDHGGQHEHFNFVQEAYAYLKKRCKGRKEEEEKEFIDEFYGIRFHDSKDFCLWDIGEPDFKKRADHYRKTGNENVFIKKKRKSYGHF